MQSRIFFPTKCYIGKVVIDEQLYLTYGPSHDSHHFIELLCISSLTNVRKDIEKISKELEIPILTVLNV